MTATAPAQLPITKKTMFIIILIFTFIIIPAGRIGMEAAVIIIMIRITAGSITVIAMKATGGQLLPRAAVEWNIITGDGRADVQAAVHRQQLHPRAEDSGITVLLLQQRLKNDPQNYFTSN